MADEAEGLGELLASLQLRLYAFGRARCGAWWNYRRVNSPFTRLLCVTRGRAEVTVAGTRHPLAAGTMLVTPPFIPVDYQCPASFEHYYAIFTARVGFGVELFSVVEGLRVRPAGRSAVAHCARLLELNRGRGLSVYDPDSPAYNEAIWRQPAADPTAGLETDGILRILLAASLGGARLRGRWAAARDGRLAKVFEHIEANLQDSLPLEQMAGLVNLHPTYFSDYFHQVTGLRPSRYLRLKRLARARLLLLTTGLELKEIAAECGFADVNYFHRAFKQETGDTPSAYRLQASPIK